MSIRVLVSACLVGWRCRYDGKSKTDRDLLSKAGAKKWSMVPVCPEVLGGLGIPREHACLENGDGFDVLKGEVKVVDARDRDLGKAFVLGALRTLDVAKRTGCGMAVLKEKSPSCGVQVVKNKGEIQKKGTGVAAALLILNGISVKGRS